MNKGIYSLVGAFVLYQSIFLISGCSFTPNSGPYSGQIKGQTTTLKPIAIDRKDRKTYYLAPLSRNSVIPFISQRDLRYATVAGDWPVNSPNTNVTMGVNIGDELQIAVFESEEGGLFVPENMIGNNGKSITLPRQFVDNRGTITIPYIGRVKVAGLSLEQVESKIKGMLDDKAIEPEIVVSFADRRGAEISVLGAVSNSRRYQLGFQKETILDVISAAGGISGNIFDTFISVQRNGKSSRAHIDRLLDDPELNITAMPSDIYFVYDEAPIYTLYGAINNSGTFSFNRETLNLVEAIGRGGSFNDLQANPAKVYVFRNESQLTLKRMGFNLGANIEDESLAVIYQIDLSEVQGLMNAKNFSVEHQDIIFIGNASSVELIKFINIINPGALTTINTNNASDSISN